MASSGSDETRTYDQGPVPGRRWLLVDGFDDPFITRVALDLAWAARDHQAELVVLGEEWGETSPFFRLCRHDMARRGRASPPGADPSPFEIDLEVAFRQAAGMPSRTRGDVRRALDGWRREASCVVDTLSPDLVIVWNGLLHLRRVYAQVVRERSVPVLFAERGLLSDTFYLDPDGVGPESRLWRARPAPTAAELAVFQARLGECVAAGKGGWPQPPLAGVETVRRTLRIPPQRRVVLFVAQVESDANLLLFSPRFRTCDAIRWCLSGLTDRDFLLVKPHPKSVRDSSQYTSLVGDRGGIAVGVHVMDAVALADVIVTINSTVALEAALQGKPVLLLEPTLPGSAAFATVRDPGVSAHEASAHCREEHACRGTTMRQAALAVGAHLDAACGHLEDLETTRGLLRRVLPPYAPFSSSPRPSLASLRSALAAGATLPRCARALRRRIHYVRKAIGRFVR